MAIKIDKDPSGILAQVANRAATSASNGAKKDVTGSTDAAPSAVNLTRLTESLKQALQSPGAEPSFDGQRVAELRDAIASGDYEVDLAATARAIVALERDIFG